MGPYRIAHTPHLRLYSRKSSSHLRALRVLPSASLIALLVLLSACMAPGAAQAGAALEGAVQVRDDMRSSSDDWPLASLVGATASGASAAPRALRDCRILTSGFEDPWVNAFRVRVTLTHTNIYIYIYIYTQFKPVIYTRTFLWLELTPNPVSGQSSISYLIN